MGLDVQSLALGAVFEFAASLKQETWLSCFMIECLGRAVCNLNTLFLGTM